MKTKALSGVLLCMLFYVAGTTTLFAANEVEPNNSISQANAISLDEVVTGDLYLDGSDNNDYFLLSLSDYGEVNLNLTTDASLTLTAYIVRPNGSNIVFESGASGSIVLSASCMGPQDVLVRLLRTAGSGSYTFDVTHDLIIESSDAEPNNSISAAVETLPENGSISGSLGFTINGTADTNDYFLFTSTANGDGELQIDISGDAVIRLYFVRTNGSIITSSDASGGSFSLEIPCLGAGDYIVRASRISGCGGYVISHSTVEPLNAEDIEPNNSSTQASVYLSDDSTVPGHLGYFFDGVVDNNDYYYVSPDENGTLSIHAVLEEGLSARIYLYRLNGSLISSTSAAGTTGSFSLDVDCIGSAEYRVLLQGISGCGGYTLSYSVDPPLAVEDAEPNNSSSEASVYLSTETPVTGHMGHAFDGTVDVSDYYLVSPDENGTLSIHAELEDGLTGRILMFQLNGSIIASTPAVGSTGSFSLDVDCIGSAEYRVQLLRIGGCGGYSLDYSIDPPLAVEDMEPNTSIALAQENILPGGSVSGHLGYVFAGVTDAVDFYELELEGNGSLTLHAEPETGLTARMFLYLPNGSIVASSPAEGFSLAENLTIDCLSAGTYYVSLSRIDGCGGYEMSYSLDSPQYNNDAEPNNSISAAEEIIPEGGNVTGQIGHSGSASLDVSDYFIIEKSSNGTLTINAEASADLSYRLQAFLPNGSSLGFSETFEGTSGSLEVNCRGIETIIVLVNRMAGCGSYSISYGIETLVYDNDIEPNNSIASAIVTSNHDNNEGHLGYTTLADGFDGSDFYRITVNEAPFDLEASIDVQDGLFARLFLYNTFGSLLTSSPSEGNTGAFNLTYTINSPGEYLVSVNYISGCGSYILGDFCGTEPEVSITPNGPLTFCPEDDVELSGTSGLSEYQWLRDGSFIGDTESVVVSTPGVYELIGYDINGCAGISSSVTIENYDVPDLVVVPDGPTTFCADESVTLNSSNGFAIYNWSTGNDTQSISVDASGSYFVNAITAEGCVATTSNTIVIEVLTLPSITISASGDTEFCQGEDIELTASTDAPLVNWSNGASGLSVIVDSGGNYSATAIAANGCEATSNTIVVEVLFDEGPCVLDCAGEAGGSAYLDECGECVGGTTGQEPCEPDSCPTDFDNNGTVNVSDLIILLSEMGCSQNCNTDLSGDGVVSVADLITFLGSFGTDCE